MCSTMTSADLRANGYRHEDGSAKAGTLAVEHDQIFNKVMSIICGMARSFKNVLYTIERLPTKLWQASMIAISSLTEQLWMTS